MEKKPKLCGHVLERTPMARGVVYGWVGKDVEVAHGEGGEGELPRPTYTYSIGGRGKSPGKCIIP